MSLSTRLRIAIVALAAIVVIALSGLYLYDFVRLAFEGTHAHAKLVADDVQDYVLEHVNRDIAAGSERPTTAAQFKQLTARLLQSDPAIAEKLRRSLASASIVLDIQIADDRGQVLVACNPLRSGKLAAPVYDFASLGSRNAFSNLWDLFNRREDYATTLPLGIGGRTQPTDSAFQIRVIVPSRLLRQALQPGFYKLGAGFMMGLAAAMFLAALLPNIVLRPLERVSKSIERISAGEPDQPARRETREFAALQSKLNVLGQQYRGAKQDALELRSNIEQLLSRLEEAVLLFDADGRLMLAGKSVERLVGRPRHEMVGRSFEEVFQPSSPFGRAILNAVAARKPWTDKLLETQSDGAPPLRVLVSVEPIEKASGGDIGTLITLRDADTRRQLAQQLDLSSRLAALSRLTSGVAHEIKNPLNAMALHLEVLKTRIEDAEPEIEVISREIKRLDHVVKTFLNFNKPVELHMSTIDLASVAREVTTLVAPDAESKGIAVETALDGPAWISGDPDLVKQALLNIVVNAIEAMNHGGSLSVRTLADADESVAVVTDNGPGIPAEVQDKIFNLYFSTKENGSGIGLAMAFRVVQMHSGTIDFNSEQGKGTSFRLRFPRLPAHVDHGLSRAAASRRH